MFGIANRRAPLLKRESRRASIACESLEGRRLLSTLQQDVTQLVGDLKTIHAGSSVTSAEIKALGADFAAIAAVATKPSSSSVSALKAELQVIIKQGSITPSEAVALKKDVTAVLASANIPTSLAQQTATDLKTIVVASGVTKVDLKLIASDLNAIVTDLAALKK